MTNLDLDREETTGEDKTRDGAGRKAANSAWGTALPEAVDRAMESFPLDHDRRAKLRVPLPSGVRGGQRVSGWLIRQSFGRILPLRSGTYGFAASCPSAVRTKGVGAARCRAAPGCGLGTTERTW
ncbi:hypothetical protein ACF07L_25085 [Streptomyces anulatus]|uniref:hypothetical protein n=1 Tax=Streptomyces anulatus TaxID=1892 RepID=UPI003701AD52